MAFVQRLTHGARTAAPDVGSLPAESAFRCQCRLKRSATEFRKQRALRGQVLNACTVLRINAVTSLTGGPELDIAKMEPLGDRILVKPAEQSPTTEGGIIMSTTSSSGFGIHDAVIGEVVAVGSEVDIKVKAGDKIVYSKYSTSDVSVPDGEVTFVVQKSVLATLS